MAVYVDEAVWEWKGKKWCHLLADNLEELHNFAKDLDLEKYMFQKPPKVKYPHYDITENKRYQAIRKGAIAIDRKETILRARLLKEQYEKENPMIKKI